MKKSKRVYGEFLPGGGYKVTDTLAPAAYDYIYQNRDILLKVDKFGPVSAQAVPPKDIVLFKREPSERFSKWQVWVRCGEKRGRYVSNFSFPRYDEPVNGDITYLPYAAYYRYDYGTFSLTTEIMLPFKGSAAVMSVTVTNQTDGALSFEVMPALYPYVNQAVIPLWDKSEWYLRMSLARGKGYTEFMTRLNSPTGDAKARRLVTFQVFGAPTAARGFWSFCMNI